MSKILAIMKKDLQTYFFSPVAYIIGVSFLLVCGYLFWVIMVSSKLATLEPLMYNAAFLLLLASPVLTMRLISEERKSNTMELLLTSPISPGEIIIGKFLACFTVYLLIIFMTFQYPLIMSRFAEKMDLGPVFSGYVGLIMLGAAFISIGLFASSLTENQVVSAMITFAALMFFWIIGWVKFVLESPLTDGLAKLSLMERYSEFTKGVIDSGNVIFFIVFTLIWLLIATRVVESDRWR